MAAASEFFCGSACSIQGKASVITSSASVPKVLIATEKSLGSDTLLFCAPETLFFLSGELRLNDQIF